MTNKELFYFIGNCIMLDEHPQFKAEILEKIKSDSIDWQKFVAICSNHLILPLIYLKFQSHKIIKYLPEELSEFLKNIYDLNRSRNNKILRQFEALTLTLNGIDVLPVFLKGAANLLDDLYSDIGERILGDIDFLVPEKDYLKSVKLLEKDGYSTHSESPIFEDIEKMKHYPRLTNPNFPADIEIHRLPVSEKYQTWFNPSIIDQEKKTVTRLSGCYVPSDNHKITHNFIHSQLTNGGHSSGIVSFRDFFDLYLLTKRSSVKLALPQIKCKYKAIAYFLLAGKALGLKKRIYNKSNFSTWILLRKHDLNLKSVAFYQIHRTIRLIINRIIIGYSTRVIKSFYSKGARHVLINCLTNPYWYRIHLQSYINFFHSNNNRTSGKNNK